MQQSLMARKKKIRAELRKRHDTRRRKRDLTRDYESRHPDLDDAPQGERVTGKGDLTRKRTVIGSESQHDQQHGFDVVPDVDLAECLPGRVLSVHGLTSEVQADDGHIFKCATRGLLKTLSTDQRHVVAAGDQVMFRPEGDQGGWIVRVEPRHGVLSRTSKGRQHVIVTNVDLLLIISSAAEPVLKPNLIDRFLITAESAGIRPIVCINKIDLVDPAGLQPLVGVYGRMGYQVLLASAETGAGIPELRQWVAGRQSVVAGQSGVGKSSLLNAIETGLQLRVREVSSENQKGRHTTTAARLIPLSQGGWIVDTPGIRQFQLWDVIAEEVAGFFRDIRPFVNLCRYPDCTHTHEDLCAVKDAVADGLIDVRRYDSYCHIHRGDEP